MNKFDDHTANIAKNVELVLESATGRWLSINHPWWDEFIVFVLAVVRSSKKGNLIKFAPCCWTFLRRKKNGYYEHKEMITLTSHLYTSTDCFDKFKQEGARHGFFVNNELFIPRMDIRHLDFDKEPCFVKVISPRSSSLLLHDNFSSDSEGGRFLGKRDVAEEDHSDLYQEGSFR